jgi:ABC-type Fe3+ transport system permease subunit
VPLTSPKSSPNDVPSGKPLRWADLVPLVGFVVPTVIIGYGFVLPRHGLGGVNELSIGFGTSILAASVTYVLGVRNALRR